MARIACSLAILLFASGEASAQASAGARNAAREIIQLVRSKFAREVAEEGAERLEGKFATAITRYGGEVDDAAKVLGRAAREVGPKTTLNLVSRHGSQAARILARHGDDGARLLTMDGAGAMKVLSALGDDGVELMIRKNGQLAATRLPQLAHAISESGKQKELISVIEKYGDRACEFLWRNKGTIFAAAALTAFLANPEPYLRAMGNVVAAPVGSIAAWTNWTAVLLVATALLAALAALRMLVFRRPGPVAKPSVAD